MADDDATLAEFVRTANVANFTKQLETETDPARRKLLMTLLAEHQAPAQFTVGTAPPAPRAPTRH